jgi:hypothetical protein
MTLEITEQEAWLPVVGWEGLYEVSDWGRVRSLPRRVTFKDGRSRSVRGGLLAPAADGGGYLLVTLRRGGGGRAFRIHCLVAEAFIGPRPAGMAVLHGPEGSRVNTVGNLRYGTHKENMADKRRDGTTNNGERNGSAKLTAEQVLEARRLSETGQLGSQRRLAAEWGVSQPALSLAIRGINWSELC